MPRFDHIAFGNSRRDERGLAHHTLRANAQYLRFTEAHKITDSLLGEDWTCRDFLPLFR
ncbi:hypothetical protein [Jannaschia sp. CCS1]|uniref:hypothetical protein n=1 Tax=Jannaschia sp. (strain CCS1) TaxID=290400 RepID=UPI0002F0E07E|nr:hypothetical protein [Jannaschia sp. CCS1]